MSLSEPATNRRELAGTLVLAIVWVFVTAIGLYLKPDAHGHGTHQRLGLPPCPSVLLLDRPCPGCGLTTSWTALLHGDWRLAFRAHALGPILYVGYSLFALATFAFAFARRRWRNAPWVDPFLIAMLTIFIGYGVVRMALTPHYAMVKERLMAGSVGVP